MVCSKSFKDSEGPFSTGAKTEDATPLHLADRSDSLTKVRTCIYLIILILLVVLNLFDHV